MGPRLAERLQRLGLHSLFDLLVHRPLRYQDRSRVWPVAALRAGQEALVEVEVEQVELRQGRRCMLLARVSDGDAALTLRFFHFSAPLRERLHRGQRLRAFGEVRAAQGLEMVHPECVWLQPGEASPPAGHLTPVYPTTEGLSQRQLNQWVDRALGLLLEQPPQDALAELAAGAGLPDLIQALQTLHRPGPDEDVAALIAGAHPAARRLALEELTAHQLSLGRLRHQARAFPARPLCGDGRLRRRWLATLPFAPTAAQRRVGREIEADLAAARPMLRLVQGDVGSGKTLVAAQAALIAIEAGTQVALMAPTELLAEQHHRSLVAWLAPLGLEIVWLAGKVKGRARAAALARVAAGQAHLVVGTQALFQEAVAFARLGLVIIDEQHRFGVQQRLALRDKGLQASAPGSTPTQLSLDGTAPVAGDAAPCVPHQLTLTATPIPRTLAMTLYADLDVSVIDELPPGRTPVRTAMVSAARRDEVIARIRLACGEGRQAYWVCTLIEESEELDAQAAEATFEALQAALPGLRLGLVHGRLRPADKAAVMAAFAAGDIQLLVATTVIEVGVDVPNASLMIIENAERLGLAQLHQLRGRVGRGAAASSCVLLYQPPLSLLARSRLAVLRDTNDGFLIARKDLELRGPGEFAGTRQTGLSQLRVADLARDQGLLPQVQDWAAQLAATRPRGVETLIDRWVGTRLRYGGA